MRIFKFVIYCQVVFINLFLPNTYWVFSVVPLFGLMLICTCPVLHPVCALETAWSTEDGGLDGNQFEILFLQLFERKLLELCCLT